jgi:F0F1-type ATP synthase assembly protein I
VPLPTPSSKSTSNTALGEGFSRAFEFAATPGVFAAIGYGLDRLFGTRPWIMIGLTLFAVVGMFVKMWIDYDASMKIHEQSAIAAKRSADARHRTSVANDFGVDESADDAAADFALTAQSEADAQTDHMAKVA